MQTIKVSCLLCKEEFVVGIDEICWPCSSHSFLLKLDKEDRATKFWRNAKEFALWTVIYLPVAVAIGREFGLTCELFWIGGGIFIQLLSPLHRWLLSKI
jgi:hypothetical protein